VTSLRYGFGVAEDNDADNPFLLSQTLARLLRSHARMKSLRALDGPALILEREAQLRDRYLDRLLGLVPTEFIHDKHTYSMDGVQRAFRDELGLDLSRSSDGEQVGPHDLPPEHLVAHALGDDRDDDHA